MIRSLSNRLKVVGPAFAGGAILSALAARGGVRMMGWVLGDAVEVWASVLTGPFAGLWFAHDWGPLDAIGWSAAIGLSIIAHPLKAGWLTGIVSAVGVGCWVLFGFALTYDGV